jgi:hypothetical protein
MISRLLPVSNFLSAGAWLLQTAATNPRIAPGLAAGKRGATLKANRAHHLFGHLEVQCFRSVLPVITHIDCHAKLLQSESSSDVVPRTCTSAGAGSRSALRSGKIAPIARTNYRRRVAAGRQ